MGWWFCLPAWQPWMRQPPSGMLPFLDVDVDQLAGPVPLVAAGRDAGRGPGVPAAGSRSRPGRRARWRAAGRAGSRSGPGPAGRCPEAPRSAARSLAPCGLGWHAAATAGQLCPPRPPAGTGRPTVLRWCARPGTVPLPAAVATRRQRRTGPGAACPSLPAGHYGGPRGPPGCSVEIVVIHTEPGGPHLSKIIYPCRRHQRPWAVQLAARPRS